MKRHPLLPNAQQRDNWLYLLLALLLLACLTRPRPAPVPPRAIGLSQTQPWHESDFPTP